VYVERPDGAQRFRWVKAPTRAELTRLTQVLALRIGRYLERQGLLERDAESSYLAADGFAAEPMAQLRGSSIAYRIAVGPQQGRKVFTLQTLPACDEPVDDGVGKVAGFSLHAAVAARADQRAKLERLCRYISRPAVAEKRLSLTPNGNVRYQLKTPYRDDTTHVIFEPLDFMAHIPVRHPTGDLRSCKSAFLPICHRPVGGLGTQAPDQPDSIPWGIRAEQQTPRAGDPGQAGQRWSARHQGGTGRADTGRTPCLDDLGAMPQAGLRHRHRDLPGLRWGSADHRVYRRPGGDREDPHPPGCESGQLRSPAVTTLPGATPALAVRLSEFLNDDSPGAAPPAARPRWRLARWPARGENRAGKPVGGVGPGTGSALRG